MALFVKNTESAAPAPRETERAESAVPAEGAPASSNPSTYDDDYGAVQAPSSKPSLIKPLAGERTVYLSQLKTKIHQQLIERLDMQTLKRMRPEMVRKEVRQLVLELATVEKGLISSNEQEKLCDEVLDETFGLGPLEALLKDPDVTDILVNRYDQVYVERRGRLSLSEVAFRDERHLRQIIDRIVARIGRRVDETSPMVDARLADGSRVNAIIPPLALDGSAMSIRRFGLNPMQLEDLLRAKAFPAVIMDFLAAAVQARCNIIISGGTGSGKTTLLNCLSRYVPAGERVITIEDAAELQLQQPHVVRLETRPSNIEGKGEIKATDLVKNCLRMRPDRIIIGETRGAEAVDMLQAMNTGHDGSMTTIHANTPRDALVRLEVLIAMAGYDIPVRGVRQQISSAINLVVQTARVSGGRRKVMYVSEIAGVEGDQIQMHNMFTFEQTGVDGSGNAEGFFKCHGIRPRVCDRIAHRGIHLPSEMFAPRRIDIENRPGQSPMHPIVFAFLLFTSAALAVWGICWIILGWHDDSGRRIKQRLHGTRGTGTAGNAEERLFLQHNNQGALGEILGRYHFFQELRASIKQSMPDLRMETFLYITAGVTVGVFLVFLIATRSFVVAGIASLVGAYVPFLVVARKRMRRQKMLAEQLPDGLDFLNRSLRAGHSLPVGLQMMGTELPAPLSNEFGRCYDEVSLGCSVEEALKAMTERIDSTDFAFFVTAVLVQRQTGGDLSQVLENISGMLRQRIQLQQHVRAKTAEGRFTGLILSAFPLVMFVILYTLNRQYAQLLLTTTVGNFFLGGAIVLSALGLHVIRKITTVKF